MFQLVNQLAVPITAQLFEFPAISRSAESSRVLRVSMFSYASEILESGGRWQHTRLRDHAAVPGRQKRTRIPPRTERPAEPTSSSVSPLLVRVCTSKRFRASM